MNQQMTKCVIDCETTGLNPLVHDLIQLAIVPINDKCQTIHNTLNIRVKAVTPETACPMATKVNGLDPTQGLSIEDSKEAFKSWKKETGIGMIIPIGFNYIFDYGFIDKWMKACGLVYREHIHYTYRDVFILANCINDVHRFQGKKVLFDSMSLTSVCKTLGIEYLNSHNALADCYLTLEAYKRMMLIA